MDIDENWFELERLHRAAADGEIAEMKRLVAAGYDIKMFDDFGWTSLHHAVKGEHYKAALWLIEPEIVELLLQKGADPDITGWMANTARLRAEMRNDAEGRQIAALIRKYHPLKK